MQCHPLRCAARQHRALRDGARHRRPPRKLCAALARAARRLDCFGLEPLLRAIPDSNEDFVYF